MHFKLKCSDLRLWQVNTSFDKSKIRVVISIYQRFEDRKLNRNMLYPPYLFRLRNIGRISRYFFDVND